MLILLPPSETKRDGGAGEPLDLRALGFPSLARTRREVLRSVAALSRDREASTRALKLGPKQAAEVDRNRAVKRATTMPAMDRYTGVLYDALDSGTLTESERSFAHRTVAVHSALFGLVAAGDRIPAYRLSFDSRLPERTMKQWWSAPIAAELARTEGLVLDFRSEGYVGLGPAPARSDSVYLRVMSRDQAGTVKALNHFNKQAKGLFSRALVENGVEFAGVDELVEWARGEGYELTNEGGELVLIVPEIVGLPGKLTASLR